LRRGKVGIFTTYPRGSIMPQANRDIASPRLYTMPELIEMRRQVLRFARSFPPGPERNNHRQIASSLRSLFRNKNWLDAHTVEVARHSYH
jgi:hypothetical protein